MQKMNHELCRTLFIDIETVSEVSKYDQLSDQFKLFWQSKTKSIQRYQSLDSPSCLIEDLYHEKAAIYAEFGKIVCISVGGYILVGEEYEFRKKSFYGHDEEQVLVDFAKMLNTYYDTPNRYKLCGHNIREFDVPLHLP